MWKALLISAFAAGLVLVAAKDTVGASGIVYDDASDSVIDTAPTQDTADFSDTQGTSDNSCTIDNQGTSDISSTSDTEEGTSNTSSTSDNEEDTSNSSNLSDTEGTRDTSITSNAQSSSETDDTDFDANDNAETDDTGCNGDPNALPGCGVNCGRTCSTYQQPGVACPAICYLNACDCKKGFVFDDAVQKCVLPAECHVNDNAGTNDTGCNGDPNALPGCGVNCGRTCSTYQQPGVACPAICYLNACDCKKGFVFDDAIQKCVLPAECPAKCTGQNEFFDECIAGCFNQTCADIGKIFNCPIQPAVCRTGCRCKPGFWRNSDNVCVPESQCPTPTCPNREIYSRCPTVKCEGDYCPKTRNSRLTCPVGIVCDPPRCVCGFNSHRDRKTGKCIATAACPPFPCNGPNEEYRSCPAVCPGENCSDYINDTTCPRFRIGIVVPCKPQCKCKKGYYRNADGVCIIGYQCGPKKSSTTTTTTSIPTTTKTITTTTKAPPTGPGKSGVTGSGSANIASLQAGISDFTGKFLYDRMQASKGKNVIISAFSVFTPLAQLALYATGDSLKQLLTVLHANSQDDIRTNFPALTASYQGQTSVIFSLAAKVYSASKYKLSDGFKNDSVNVFNAESQEINFGDTSKAADTINQWVASKTNNRITDLVSRDMFSEDTRIALVNAILFKGTWLYQFNAKNTQDQPFYLEDGTKKTTKLMYQEATLKYGEVNDLDCKTLEMFYKGKNFSMVVVLPNKINNVMTLAEKLQDFSLFDKVLASLRSQKVKVWLPKFETKTKTDLSDILKKQNVTKIFGADAGLKNILAQPQEVSISTAVQDAIIIVNEEGSEAAAANAFIGMRTTSIREVERPPEFRADHSFLYYILVKGTPVFSGSFRNPN